MSKTILIYDSDSLCYRAAAGIEKHEVLVTHIKTGKQKIFKNRTEHKKSIEEKGKSYNKEDWVFEDKYETLDVNVGIRILENQIAKINSELFADEYLMGIQGKSNFRDSYPYLVSIKVLEMVCINQNI